MGTFMVAKHNVLLIMITVMLGFSYTGTLMICYGHNLGFGQAWILDNL